MRLAAIALLLLFQDIQIKPRLTAGDEFRLEVTRIRENSQRPQANGRSRMLVDVRVVSAGPTGYVMDWTMGPTTFDNPLVAQDPMVAAAARAVQQIQLQITLNSDGEFTGLANEAQVAQQLQSITRTLMKEVAAAVPSAQRAQLESAMGQVLTPALLISSATREVQIYFGLNGAELAPGDALEVPLDQPSPVGGGTIPAKYRVSMDSAAAESADISTTMTYDAEALRQMTAALVKQMGAPVSQAELAALPAMQLSDDGRYAYSRTHGLMREVTVNRRIVSGPVQRLDGWIIRLVSPPKR